MKLSILSSEFDRFPLEKQFEMVASLGFDGIELSGIRPYAYAPDMDQSRIERILTLKERYHLEIPLYSPELLRYPYNISSPNERERRDTIAYLKRAVEVAKAVGARGTQITCGHAGYDTDRHENFRHMVEVLKEVSAHAEETGIDLFLKPLTIMESNTIVMIDSAVELIQAVNSHRLKAMLDSTIVMTNWESLDGYFEKLGNLLSYIHWGTSTGTAEEHLKNSANHMDDAFSFFAKIRQRGYDGWVGIKMSSDYIRESEMHASREHRQLREIFAHFDRQEDDL